MLMPSIFNDGLFDDFMDFPMSRAFFGRNSADYGGTLMRTDVKDVDGGYELDIDLPGYRKEDIRLQLKEGYLTVSASKNADNDEKDENGKYIRRERYSGQCSRSFFIGKSIAQEDVHAKYENGILKLSFPKEEAKKAVEEQKYISIEG